jgi:general secretion pathway protein E
MSGSQTIEFNHDDTNAAAAGEAWWLWQEQAAERSVALSEYLNEELARRPEFLTPLAQALGMQALSAEQCRQASPRFDALSLTEALNCRAAPLDVDGELLLALADPFSRAARLKLQSMFSGRVLRFALCPSGVVDAWLKQAEASERVMDGVAVDMEDDPSGQHDALRRAAKPCQRYPSGVG